MDNKTEILLSLVRDLAEHGTRFDTNPTMNYAGTVWEVAGRFTKYIHRIDDSIRERAQQALKDFGVEDA